MERGSKYEAYANLRESKLRMKQTKTPPENQDSVNNIIPAKKPLKFQGQKSFHAATNNNRGKGAGLYAQSAAPVMVSNTRNDYRKPALPAVVEKYAAPAGKSCSKVYDTSLRSGGYQSSVPEEEKRKKGIFTAIRSSRRAMQTWMK